MAVLVAVVGLAGCSWNTVIDQQMARVSPDRSISYRQGYDHGCRSAISERGTMGTDRPDFTRDDARMKSDADYALGWGDGIRVCGNLIGGGSTVIVPVR